MDDPPPERELPGELTERELRDEEIAKLAGTRRRTAAPIHALPRQAPKRPPKPLLSIGVVILALWMVWLVFSLIPDTPAAPTAPRKSTKAVSVSNVEAAIVAKRFIKAGLNFPEEAEFPGMFSSRGQAAAYKIGKNAWGVQGEVIGKNAFGVKIRNHYVCELKFTGGDWMRTSNWELLELYFFKPSP